MAPPAAKKTRTEAPDPAAPGAAAGTATAAPASLSITALLEMDSLQGQAGFLTKWASEMKAYVDKALIEFLIQRKQEVAFKVPSSVLLIRHWRSPAQPLARICQLFESV